MTTAVKQQPTETYADVPLDKLMLDPENPRLSIDIDWHSQSEMSLLSEFMLRYNLRQLAQSISDKGFRPRQVEALLVVANEEPADSFTVIEGNRRLATLRLLTSKEVRQQAEATWEWEKFSENAQRFELDPVPVIIYPDRTTLNDYHGFRHITGPQTWQPEATARFITRLLKSGRSTDEIARRIGSNPLAVRCYAETYAIYRQAMAYGMPVEPIEARFGIFYYALSDEGIREFLGLPPQMEARTLPNSPVGGDQIHRLSQLIEFLYGDASKQINRVIQDSGELSKLGEVLNDDIARTNLVRDRNLDEAWRSAGGGRVELLGLIRSAFSRLAEGYGKSLAYPEDEEVRLEMERLATLSARVANHYDLDQASR